MASPKTIAIYQRQIAARERLWPGITNKHIWNRTERDGFVTMPRAMPLIMRIMDHLAGKGVPVSQVYLDIWCRSFDEGFIALNRPDEMAYCSGFNGQRALRTWKDRVARLGELGFIDIKPGPYGPLSFALILNPYHVISRANDAGLLESGTWESLVFRAAEIQATDFDDLDANGEVKPDTPSKTPPTTPAISGSLGADMAALLGPVPQPAQPAEQRAGSDGTTPLETPPAPPPVSGGSN